MSSTSAPVDLAAVWEQLQFPHPVTERRLLQTHISWVVLTGAWAYKFKKPVRFDFLDYSTLAQRLACCQNELARNRAWAPELYAGLAALIHDRGSWQVVPWPEGVPAGAAVREYAVRMQEFPQAALLANQLAAAAVGPAQIESLAERLASLQRDLPVVQLDAAAAVAAATAPPRENFKYLLGQLPPGAGRARIAALEAWSAQESARLGPTFIARARAGFVRRGHGDLHLHNVLFWQGKFVPFDGIEFNARLSDIDTLNEIAFLQMELSEHGYTAHAHRFLNRYLESSGDYAGLAVLRYYLVYRALVRAKVDFIRQGTSGQAGTFSPAGEQYLRYAEASSKPVPPRLAITMGFSGSGKSTRAAEWVARDGYVRLRSDVVRKELAGRDPLAKSAAADLPQLYNAQATEATYACLAARAEQILAAGYAVIVDATFLRRRQRQLFLDLAARWGIELQIVACTAPPAELRRRLQARGPDPSDADAEVLRHQLENFDPLQEDEVQRVDRAARPESEV